MVYLNYWYTISLGIKCMQYKLQYVEDMLSFHLKYVVNI